MDFHLSLFQPIRPYVSENKAIQYRGSHWDWLCCRQILNFILHSRFRFFQFSWDITFYHQSTNFNFYYIMPICNSNSISLQNKYQRYQVKFFFKTQCSNFLLAYTYFSFLYRNRVDNIEPSLYLIKVSQMIWFLLISLEWETP